MSDETPPVDAYEGIAVERAGRVPPQNIDAEESVLGGVLLKNDALHEVHFLEAEDFYRDKHRKIYAAMRDLSDCNEPIDLVTLSTRLKDTGDLDAAGGVEFLAYLAGRVPHAANILFYGKVVRGKALARRLIEKCQQTIDDAYKVESQAESKLLAQHQQGILEIIVGANWNKTVSSRQAVRDALAKYEEAAENIQQQLAGAGISTGLSKLDHAMGKLLPGRFYTFGGDSGDGKSVILHQIKRAAALQGYPVTFYSVEMDAAECVNRDMTAIGEVPNEKLMFSQLDEKELDSYVDVAGDVAKLPVNYIDDPKIGWEELLAIVRSHVANADKKQGVFVLDYLSKLASNNQDRYNDEFKLLRKYSGALKALARETGWSIVTASQIATDFSKKAEAMVRDGKRRPTPRASDLFGGKVLFHDSDALAMLNPSRDDSDNKDGTMKCVFLKNRMLPALKVAYLIEDFDHMRFLDNPTHVTDSQEQMGF